MKISEMREIAGKRTPGEWHIGHINESLDRGEIVSSGDIIVASDCRRNDEPFICLTAATYDRLLDVAEAANDMIKRLNACSDWPAVKRGQSIIEIWGSLLPAIEEACAALEIEK